MNNDKELATVQCFDKFDNEIFAGDTVDVQKNGKYIVYKKDDDQLYFKPYNIESRVYTYFAHDLIKL